MRTCERIRGRLTPELLHLHLQLEVLSDSLTSYLPRVLCKPRIDMNVIEWKPHNFTWNRFAGRENRVNFSTQVLINSTTTYP